MKMKKGTPEILKGKIPRDHTGPRIVPIPSGKPKIYRGLGRLLKRVLPQKWKKNSTKLGMPDGAAVLSGGRAGLQTEDRWLFS